MFFKATTLVRFALTTHSSSLLGGRRRDYIPRRQGHTIVLLFEVLADSRNTLPVKLRLAKTVDPYSSAEFRYHEDLDGVSKVAVSKIRGKTFDRSVENCRKK
jgi:hypothetical protein